MNANLSELDNRFGNLLASHMQEQNLSDSKLAKLVWGEEATEKYRLRILRWRMGHIKPSCEAVEQLSLALGLLGEQRTLFFEAVGCLPPPELKLPFESWPVIGVPITQPAQFFGQIPILRRIRQAWQTSSLQHVAIIGKRRAGKTSLLYYLKNIADTPADSLRSDQPQGWDRWMPQDFQFVLVDFQLAEMCQQSSLLRHILQAVQLWDPEIVQELHLWDAPESCDLIKFSEILNDQLQRPTVILLDEIGKGLQSPSLDQTFWQNMRALGNHCAGGKLGFIVTAHEPLEKLVTDLGKSSPFFNVFNFATLDPFTEKEALDLMDSFFAKRQLPSKKADMKWIFEESLGWPALIQVFCLERLLALENGEVGNGWRRRGLEQLANNPDLQNLLKDE